jgi:DNA helicase-4
LKHTAIELIDKLIAGWNYFDLYKEEYLTVVAPGIMRLDGSVQLKEEEKKIVAVLHELLSPEEWAELPELIKDRQAGNLEELSSDRERAEAQRKARRREEEARARRKEQEEHKKREIELEIERQEWQRRKAEEERHKTEEAGIARKKALSARLKDAFKTDFLSADGVLAGDPDAELISGEEYAELKAKFVGDWVTRELQQPLDSEQAVAVAATGGDIQVVARAGSGKTRTLVTRAIFLQKHCRVSPRELLLLAFNRNAVDQMKNRLAHALGKDLPHVMTFHALAHALVHPEEELVFDDTLANQLGLSREVQEVIDEHVRSQKYGNRIRDLMLAHFREDWERIVAGGFQLTMEEFLAHHRALPRESLKGDFVKSFGEKVIANALFENGVEYRYERNFRWNGVNYRPDFTIPFGPKGGVVIEYFGLKGDADYDKMSQVKREFWAESDDWTFLEFSPRDLAQNGVDAFVHTLLRELQKAGVSSQRRSEEEIWELVRRRALDGFTKAMRTFVGRCRKLNLSPDDLELMIAGHTACSTAEALFLDVGVSVYRDYLERLAAGKKEDFDGLMWRSVLQVRKGQTRFARDKGREQGDVARMKFVMIDEFQDFSAMFFELVDAIRSANPNVQFFCVGDDWQAINAFAGSDLSFFVDFSEYFRDTTQCYIRNNYRSPVSVVELGNALMYGRGEAAKPERRDSGWVRLCKLNEFRPSASEQARHKGDEITPAVLRLVRSFLDRGLDVVMLSRRNGLPWYVGYEEATSYASDAIVRFVEHIRSHLPKEDRGRVTGSTAHGYKGLEQSAVVVLDAVKRSYPLVHPNWVFLRVFGDSINRIEDEERRLFYVATTRAKDSLALVTETLTESPYLGDIRRQVRFSLLSWADLPPVPSLDGARLEIRVFNAYNAKDQLKNLGYQYEGAGKYWHKTVLAEGFSFDALLSQPWARQRVRIDVCSETGELLQRR